VPLPTSYAAVFSLTECLSVIRGVLNKGVDCGLIVPLEAYSIWLSDVRFDRFLSFQHF